MVVPLKAIKYRHRYNLLSLVESPLCEAKLPLTYLAQFPYRIAFQQVPSLPQCI